MQKMNVYRYAPVGSVTIGERDGRINYIDFGDEIRFAAEIDGAYQREETPIIHRASRQLHEYFHGERQTFELPLLVEGTPFQRRVWEALQTIPYGETRSYKQLAEMIENPRASRAVGMANNRNRISIVIPCHRVIGADGGLVGYGGGVHIKEVLLRLERAGKGAL